MSNIRENTIQKYIKILVDTTNNLSKKGESIYYKNVEDMGISIK